MYQRVEIKLIDKYEFAEKFNVEKGRYMKIEEYKGRSDETIASKDTENIKG